MADYAAQSRIDTLQTIIRVHAPVGPFGACRPCHLAPCTIRLDALDELRSLGALDLPRREVARHG